MTRLSRFDPFSEMQALQKQFFGDDWLTAPSRRLQNATTDVYMQDDKQMVIEAHLPNFDQANVDISLDNGVLQIQAEKHEKVEDKAKKYVVRESSSSFYRRIRLPKQADAERIEAHMADGVLTVTVPLRKLPAPKKVTINTRGRTSKK